jgi:hypothetical protein
MNIKNHLIFIYIKVTTFNYRYLLGGIILLCCFLFLILIFTNNDWTTYDFEKFQELQTSGLVEKGWVPNWLPKESVLIKVNYSIDTNQRYITAYIEKKAANFIPYKCEITIKTIISKEFDSANSVFYSCFDDGETCTLIFNEKSTVAPNFRYYCMTS